MKCRQAERHLACERDSALDEVQRAALARHITECASCRRMKESLTIAVEGWRAGAEEVRVPDAEIEWQNIRRQIRGGQVKEQRSLVAWLGISIGAAATVAVGLFFIPTARNGGTAMETATVAARESGSTITSRAQEASTVVFVDDKSGWTFVVGPQPTG
jgi:predicted anti-sigma-YlaC factor YlaD